MLQGFGARRAGPLPTLRYLAPRSRGIRGQAGACASSARLRPKVAFSR